jgi:starch phosphorylase
LERIQKLTTAELKGIAVYLPDYRTALARLLTSGCDIWLNTPVVGFEASGTSGMKAALNGVLPVTTRDGWVDEAELYKVGWIVNSDNINRDLLDVLERDIIPFYYAQNSAGVPQEWIENMKNARALIVNQFSATRMLKDYITKFYLPMLQAHLARQQREAPKK